MAESRSRVNAEEDGSDRSTSRSRVEGVVLRVGLSVEMFGPT